VKWKGGGALNYSSSSFYEEIKMKTEAWWQA
jgi:hypothetical protein